MRRADPSLDIRPVEYAIRITQWRELLKTPESLGMVLTPVIRETSWDIVLVGAPNGFVIVDEYLSFLPIQGRMLSIYVAKALSSSGGFVFVHGAQREVENAC